MGSIFPSITKPTKLMKLTHNDTGATLILVEGNEVTINTRNISVSGKVADIFKQNNTIIIKLEGDDWMDTTFVLNEIVSIGLILLEYYTVTTDDSLGDYEIELDQDSQSISINKGDIVEIVYTDDCSNDIAITGIFFEFLEEELIIKKFFKVQGDIRPISLPLKDVKSIQVLANA